MPPVNYNAFHSFIQGLAASPSGSRFLARALPFLDRWTLKFSGNRTTASSLLTGVPVIMLTTTGARTGLPRTSPLLPVHDPAHPGSFAIIASNFGQHHFPSWYYNLKKNPLASACIRGRLVRYTADEAAGEEYQRFWAYANDTYFGYGLYGARAGRRIPILVLTPLES